MCGIAGFISLKQELTGQSLALTIKAMNAALHHRGPNDNGYWLDTKNQIALGHTRLSILDLSENGHQPMLSPSNRFIISYNGEVYNFLELKKKLPNKNFHSKSDTEVIAHALDEYGVIETIEKLNGMFALTIYDTHTRKLYLTRDRLGKKPLYYGKINGYFVFGSELKAIRKLPNTTFELDNQALYNYLQYNYVPCPLSIYKNINKLEAATILTFNLNDSTYKLENYWQLKNFYQQTSSTNNTLKELECLIDNGIKSRLVSDVPLGAFLSGGVDSSLVVAKMQKFTNQQVKTFSIGFLDKNYDEAKHAKKIATHLNSEHYEYYVSDNDAINVIPKLADVYDEPFADSSQIPTYIIAKLAKQNVSVILSGDGGDEIFAGYNRYIFASKLWQKIKLLPLAMRKPIAKMLLVMPPSFYDLLAKTLPEKISPKHFANKIYKFASIIDKSTELEVYKRLISKNAQPNTLLKNAVLNNSVYANIFDNDIDGFIESMQYADSLSYLPDDILVKVDRASMAVSLETRVPLLDYKIVEFAASINLTHKINNGKTKAILRDILYQYVPKELIERPKQGFAIPVGEYMRGALKDFTYNYLNKTRIQQQNIFNSHVVDTMLTRHMQKKADYTEQLWGLLMFQTWHERWQKP